MKKCKRLIALLLALVIIISSFALSVFTAFGKTQRLILDVKMTSFIDGEDDRATFIYTPEVSGTYSLLSYNTPASECYLFIKEVNPETKYKEYKQLAYAINDPNYQENGHNSRQFCLTYHLEAGVTYYYEVGWYLSQTRTDGNTTVMLRCDSYDKDIDYITASTSAKLDYYTGGTVKKDSDGAEYFYYDITRITSNMVVTVYYTDGTSVTSTKPTEVDGMPVVYKHNQDTLHWYPGDNPNYNGNELIVSVYDKTCVVNVEIDSSALAKVRGVVTDSCGNPLEGAVVFQQNGSSLYTDENGEFSFLSVAGSFQYTVSYNKALSRSVTIVVSSGGADNDFRSNPIELCCYDYVTDGIINAKDYSLINRTNPDNELKADFQSHINFTANDYPQLTLSK